MNPYMNKDTIVRHFIFPVIMPVLFFAAGSSPVDLLGCKTRGLIALSIAFLSGLAGLGTAVIALKGNVEGAAGSERWIATTLILAIPVVAMFVLA